MVFGIPVDLQNQVVELEESNTIRDLLKAAEPIMGEYRTIKDIEAASFIVNNQYISGPLSFELHEGDTVLVLMPMAGG